MMGGRIITINDEEYNLDSKSIIGFSFLDNNHFHQRKISDIGLDLLYFGLAVCVADRRIKRSDYSDCWTRTINIVFPAIEDEKWSRNKENIEKMLSFLSGDYWQISFIKAEEREQFQHCKNTKKCILKEDEKIDIAMLSAGLDSYIGAIDILSDSHKTIFVNIHSGGNSYEKDFDAVRDSLVKEFDIKNYNQFFFTYGVTPKKGVENSTRARSFTFFTHALALSTCFNNVENLIIPENGTISLNVPLTMGRYGSSSTRTTHPFYLDLLRKIIKSFGLQINIVNPYQFKTKGEMIVGCKNLVFLQNNIKLSMSCSHPSSGRYAGRGLGHCGLCLPCLIRKSAELKAFGEFKTEYTDVSLREYKRTRENQSTIRCLKYKISNLENVNYEVDVLKNGLIRSNLQNYIDLYKRSLEELKALVQFIKDDE